MFSLLALSLQSAYAASYGPAALRDPNVLVAPTAVPVWYQPWTAHTNLLLWVGGRQDHDESEQTPLAVHGPLAFTPSGYSPAQIGAAYNVPANGGTKAIAIIDAYNYATAKNDFNVFSSQFGLPTETSSNVMSASNKVFQVVWQGTSQPPANPNRSNWNEESAIDIEWAHAMAPNAKIYLIEANSPGFSDLLTCVLDAAALPGVSEISMSWGVNDQSGELPVDPYFVFPGVNLTLFAASGDTAAIPIYPSTSPYVVAVGGTSLQMNSSNVVTSETGWSDTGGGLSGYEPLPMFQWPVGRIVRTKRGVPDVAAVGDPNTGVAAYDSAPDGIINPGWNIFGGTSVASPIVAGITNTRGTFLVNSTAELFKIYGGLGGPNFRDITSGTAGANKAKVGYDFVTGVGTPIGPGL